MASPGNVWTTSELARIFNRPERSIRRTTAKLTGTGIAVRISNGIALDPFIVNALRANITSLRKLKEKTITKGDKNI
jgi:hypothetical protein